MPDEQHYAVQQRHKPPTALTRERELIVACAPLRSNVNLSRIVRTAGCCGVRRMICCGAARIIGKIARDSIDDESGPAAVEVRVHRTLSPPLRELKQSGYRLVGLEQTAGSTSLFDYRFERRSVLVVGNERLGLDELVLRQLDDVVEIPVYGLPHAYNVATAAAMALYEYCRQYPTG
ncbi:MAG TPA: TrmH family RNA methyltransferase [Pirellulales bacterium]|nr:TrmH family RNA methyltransferase [Pirellulales bacterium]